MSLSKTWVIWQEHRRSIKIQYGNGLQEVRIGVGSMVKGFLAAQVAMKGLQTLWMALKQGVSTAIRI